MKSGDRVRVDGNIGVLSRIGTDPLGQKWAWITLTPLIDKKIVIVPVEIVRPA